MKDSDKAFYQYLKGKSRKEIAAQYGVEPNTVASWSQRGINGKKWAELKEECINDDGSINNDVVKLYMSGKGNLNPTNAGINTYPSVYKLDNTEENRKFISNTLKNSVRFFNVGIPKSDIEVQIRIEGYFNTCINEGIIPTVEGLANCLGISVSTLWDWETNRKNIGKNRGAVRAEYVKNAKQCIQEFDAQMAISGKMRDITYIFRAKNYYGMRDQVDTVVTHNKPLGEQESKEDLQARIMQMPDDN